MIHIIHPKENMKKNTKISWIWQPKARFLHPTFVGKIAANRWLIPPQNRWEGRTWRFKKCWPYLHPNRVLWGPYCCWGLRKRRPKKETPLLVINCSTFRILHSRIMKISEHILNGWSEKWSYKTVALKLPVPNFGNSTTPNHRKSEIVTGTGALLDNFLHPWRWVALSDHVLFQNAQKRRFFLKQPKTLWKNLGVGSEPKKSNLSNLDGLTPAVFNRFLYYRFVPSIYIINLFSRGWFS